MATVYFDGASKSNPGRAACGAILLDEERGVFLGTKTNNEAEYSGLILALELAVEKGIKNLEVRGDSLLVIMQMSGKWKLKAKNLFDYHAKAVTLAKRFDKCTFVHIPREKNGAADALCNRILDENPSESD